MDDDVREVNDDRSKGLFLKNIRSGRLRAFAFRPRLESFCCIFPSLDVCCFLCNLNQISQFLGLFVSPFSELWSALGGGRVPDI
ncbi:hypothetical protein NC651_018413 [Populus alba x Populus x berolinensis]|nr:hypothetical protein NC651_018413 [Populus alba x Populus x berolinensis]